jgi:uncharacterized repeat protein (TIGR03803 family)
MERISTMTHLTNSDARIFDDVARHQISQPSFWKSSCAVFLLWVAAAIASPAQTFTVLHSFDGTHGGSPSGALVQGTDGNFYGPASIGGPTGICSSGCGTLFKITPGGALTTIHDFNGRGGFYPIGALVQTPGGSFYGATAGGGNNGVKCYIFKQSGCGTLFELTSGGSFTSLHSFDNSDGNEPMGLALGNNGNFYGVANSGGTDNNGTVFETTPGGTFTLLFNFALTAAYPWGLTAATNGNFYGTAEYGGTESEGQVFEVTPSGTVTTLYSFCAGGDCTEGAYPLTGLIQGTDGDLYGTTYLGGTSGNGAIYQLTLSGTATSLYSFPSQDFAQIPLAQGTDGNFYGVTLQGGANDDGVIFEITPDGTLTSLYSFCPLSGCPDGAYPSSPLIQGTDGLFYGSTIAGGAIGYGTVFSLDVGLGPFVETLPALGRTGAPVKILGTDLTGATSVSFNGTPATFTVASPSLIRTNVPTGATTGQVQVTTPSGTLNSNVVFRVAP